MSPPEVLREHVDGPIRLSESALWRLVREYYATRGPQAWGDAGVPYVITNTTYLARSVARVVAGFLDDLEGGRQRPAADPVYVIELGAGSGRFGYRFLHWLRRTVTAPLSPTPSVCHVLTDFNEDMIDHWSTHPRLAPLIAEGLVDVARFDVERDSTIHLRHRGISLEPGRPQQAMVILANYVLDSLPADVFAKSSDGIDECLVALSRPPPEADAPGGMEDLVLDWTRTGAPVAYYEDPEIDTALADCAAHLAEGIFSFPVAAMRGLSRLYGLADSVLLLAADKGYTQWTQLEGRGYPELARHGSVSLMVNFCALRSFNERRGGVTLSSARYTQRLPIEGFIATNEAAMFPATRHAYAEAVDEDHPDDVYRLWQSCRSGLGDWTAEQLLHLLRASSWDSDVALSCLPHLTERAAGAHDALVDELEEMADEVWALSYPINESADLAFDLGKLLLAAGRARGALLFFSRSVDLRGPTAATSYHMAVCCRSLGDIATAGDHAGRALELDAGHHDAATLLAELDGSAG